jgi:hypothetical protein
MKQKFHSQCNVSMCLTVFEILHEKSGSPGCSTLFLGPHILTYLNKVSFEVF